jgi:hypothetical protein
MLSGTEFPFVNEIIDAKLRKNCIPDYGDILAVFQRAKRIGEISMEDAELTEKGV